MYVLLEYRHTNFLHIVWLLLYFNSRVEFLWQRPNSLQSSLKYFLLMFYRKSLTVPALEGSLWGLDLVKGPCTGHIWGTVPPPHSCCYSLWQKLIPGWLSPSPRCYPWGSLMKAAGSPGFCRPRIMTSGLPWTPSSIQNTHHLCDDVCSHILCPLSVS